MISAKRIITIVGTLFCALAAGFVMQNFLQKPAPSGPTVQVASASSVAPVVPLATEVQTDAVDAPLVVDTGLETETDALAAGIPVPPGAAPTPTPLPDTPVAVAALDDGPIQSFPAEEPAPSFGCEVKAHAISAATALVQLDIDASCLANEAFSLHHNGMIISGATDGDGLASLMVPALSEQAVFIITFLSGDSVVAKAEVSSVEYYHRAVVQWSAMDGPQVHALEYGADYGEEGHVWMGAPGDMADAATGQGGFILRLGDDSLPNAHVAEVYTFPLAIAQQEGAVELSLEAEVSAENCGRDLEAQVLQKSGLDPMHAVDLTLAMPDCDATGELLVLKNVFDDLKIARN